MIDTFTSAERLEDMTRYITERLLGIDSVAGCNYGQQHNICIKFIEGVCDSLGIHRDEIINALIKTEVHYSIDNYYE